MRLRKLATFILTASTLQASGVLAQAVLEEVVVTAQKRLENQQDVPISISALSGDELQKQNLVELETFSVQMPNLHISESAIGDKLFIRGIGSGINAGFEQSVATFIDGVYFGRSLQTRSQFLDIQSVEVLRGPQSTYFGNNSIAGALNISTRKPTGEFNGYINTFYEFEHNEQHIEGAVGGALSDSLSVRVSGLSSSVDGWVNNTLTGQTEGDEDNQAVRVSFAFKPSETFDANLKLETGSFEVLGRNLQVLDCPPSTGAAGTCAIVSAPVLAAFGPAFAEPLFPNFDDSFNLNTQYNGPVPPAYTAAVNSLGAFEAGLAVPAPSINTYARDMADLQNSNATLSMSWQLPGDFELTSVTGFSEYDFDFTQTTDFLPIPSVGVKQLEEFQQLSQELRIVSPLGEHIDWLAGVYFQSNELTVGEDINLYLPPPYFQPAATFFTDACRLPSQASNPACRLPATIAAVNSMHKQEEDSYSVFASTTWHINDAVRATLGARYMNVDKTLERVQAVEDLAPGVTVPCPPSLAAPLGCVTGAPLLITANSPPQGSAFGWGIGALDLSRSDSDFMPSVNLQWDIRSNAMLYGSFTQGFKAGGFDQRNLFLNAVTGQFDPEQVNSWELGLKTDLLAGDLRLNLALFRSEYEDLQVSTFDGVVNFLVNNAASARSQGLEMDVRWLLNDYLIVGASVALLDAKWENFASAQCAAFSLATAPNSQCNINPDLGLLVQDLSGQDLLMSPDYSGNFSVDYFLPLSNGLELQSQLLLYFEGDKYLSADNDPATLQESFAKLNFRIALQSDSGWELALVGRNLTDKLTSGHSEDVPLRSINSFFRLTDRPRTIALQMQYHW